MPTDERRGTKSGKRRGRNGRNRGASSLKDKLGRKGVATEREVGRHGEENGKCWINLQSFKIIEMEITTSVVRDPKAMVMTDCNYDEEEAEETNWREIDDVIL